HLISAAARPSSPSRLSLHDALPISALDGTKISGWQVEVAPPNLHTGGIYESYGRGWLIKPDPEKENVLNYGEWNNLKIRVVGDTDRKSTRLNSSHVKDSYAVLCLK